jgi:hypothetical protein
VKQSRRFIPLLIGLAIPTLAACGPTGVQGSSEVAEMPVTGTIYTIVMENEGAGVLSEMPYAQGLANRYASASAYYSDHHPSLPNYLLLTSGTDNDVTDDDGPDKHPVGGTDNLADQLDAAGVSWRAYMEDMGEPCLMRDKGKYSVHHNPFVYYTSLANDAARCQEHDVDMATHFADDLKSNAYDFMWITPNKCNDGHDCSPATADAWLAKLVPQIMASDGYKQGGAIFLVWDEGGPDATYVFGGKQTIPFVVVSDHLVKSGFSSDTLYTHASYLSTIEDLLGLPRLSTTTKATPMVDFFATPPAPLAGTGGAAATGATGGITGQ